MTSPVRAFEEWCGGAVERVLWHAPAQARPGTVGERSRTEAPVGLGPRRERPGSNGPTGIGECAAAVPSRAHSSPAAGRGGLRGGPAHWRALSE